MKVVQVSRHTGEVINLFESAAEAAKVVDVSSSCISRACRKGILCVGCQWRYATAREIKIYGD